MKKVDFMCTAFRDGFQSVYGARVFTKDFMPAVDAARKAGITVPIIPGIMPVTNYNQINRMIQMSGCKVPLKLLNQFDRYKDDKEAIEEIGLIFTSYQILDLMANDVDGIHIYSMNRSGFISKLMDNISYDSLNIADIMIERK